jgi:hypothetical protein
MCEIASRRSNENLPVHSFQSLMADLATVTRNAMAMPTVLTPRL